MAQGQITGILRNRLDHAVVISYGDDTIVVAPRGTTNELVKEKLGSLPNGVVFIQK